VLSATTVAKTKKNLDCKKLSGSNMPSIKFRTIMTPPLHFQHFASPPPA
jgi:hypothetical protein